MSSPQHPSAPDLTNPHSSAPASAAPINNVPASLDRRNPVPTRPAVAPPSQTDDAASTAAAQVGAAVLEDRRRRMAHIDSGSSSAPVNSVVSIDAVHKKFGSVEALGSLSLTVQKGQITVLLGPNGAGKTTAIRMITGALEPDNGTVNVLGLDPTGPGGETVRSNCGVVSAKPSLYDRLSGFDNLRYAAELYGLGRGTAADNRITEAANQFGIANDLAQRVGGYSTGMKTRLALARAVLHQPTLMLLDEPTSGLDPESAVAVLAMVRHMTAEGKTVLMCTHLLLEAERLADHIVVMDNGSDLLAGHPDALAKQFWPNATVEITTTGGQGLDRLQPATGVTDYQRHEETAILQINSPDQIPALVEQLTMAGAAIRSVVPYQPSLEDLYFAIRRQYGMVGDGWDQGEAK